MKLLLIVSLSFFLVSCGLLNNFKTHKDRRDKLSSELTVTNIHDRVVLGKTSRQDIKKLFGKPKVIERDSETMKIIYEKWTQDETGINVFLSEGTDYWETVKYVDDGSSFSYDEFTVCYQYQSESLGIKAVYFFFIDDRLEGFVLDDTLKNKKSAQRDRYLRDWID